MAAASDEYSLLRNLIFQTTETGGSGPPGYEIVTRNAELGYFEQSRCEVVMGMLVSMWGL